MEVLDMRLRSRGTKAPNRVLALNPTFLGTRAAGSPACEACAPVLALLTSLTLSSLVSHGLHIGGYSVPVSRYLWKWIICRNLSFRTAIRMTATM